MIQPSGRFMSLLIIFHNGKFKAKEIFFRSFAYTQQTVHNETYMIENSLSVPFKFHLPRPSKYNSSFSCPSCKKYHSNRIEADIDVKIKGDQRSSQFPLATRPLGAPTLVEHSPHSFRWRRGLSGHRHLWNIHLTVSLGDEAPRGIDTCGTFTSQFRLATRPLRASTLVEHSPHSFAWRRGPSGHRYLWNIHLTVSFGDEAPWGIDTCGTFTSQFRLPTRPLGASTLVEHSPHSFHWRRGPSRHRHLWNIHLTVSLGDEAPRGIDSCGTFTSQFHLATRPLGASTLVEHSPHSFPWRRGPSRHRHFWNIHLRVSLGDEAPRGIDTCGTITSQFPLARRPFGASTLLLFFLKKS